MKKTRESYWSDRAGLLPRGQDRPGQLGILQAGVIYHVKEELVYLGVDIAKAYLDAAIGNEKRRFSNDAVGHRESLINWIKQIAGPVQAICEPEWRLRTSLRPGACLCADASQPGASKLGESICPRSWYFSQDRSDRRPSALRLWRSDEATDDYGVKSGARAFARTKKANAVT